MQYVKAKFLKENKPTGKAYTYRCESEVKAGDIVADDKCSKLIIVDEPIEHELIRVIGVEKIRIVKKYVELNEGED